MRGEHVNDLAYMKVSFGKEIERQRANEGAKVEEIRRQANQVYLVKNFLLFCCWKLNFRKLNNFCIIER
jgi:hypothetical protein